MHGVSRATRDLDLLVLARECLDAGTWTELHAGGVEARIYPGSADDPLAGVVRFSAGNEPPVDLVIGRHPWQASVLARARETPIMDATVPVAGRGDLILLKLYAGGPQDAWDIEQLLEGEGREAIVADVEAALDALPPECRELWVRIRRSGRS